jgi:quercetin dioxygenase-like cupin family protein
MKTNKMISASLFFLLLLTSGSCVFAQDIMKVGQNLSNKVLLDNDQVRVMQIESVPGVATPWHSHPNNFIYALTDGKLEITDQGKKPVIYEIKAGQVVYFPAVTHMVKNVGTTTLKMILTELKPVSEK